MSKESQNAQLVALLHDSLLAHTSQNAFCIDDKMWTYGQLMKRVAAIRCAVRECESIIGLVANDDLNTYASILALWMEGRCYVPLHPLQPLQRCNDIISQVDIKTILDSGESTRYDSKGVIMTAQLPDAEKLDAPCEVGKDAPAYILFTSGTTGRPKGVPVTFGNVEAFLEAFALLGISLLPEDRCLQMFDLTFDLSVGSYLPPLIAGACVYTVRLSSIKWQEVFRLMDDYRLTVTLMVPSVIHYLRPYLSELSAPDLRYSLFCGEALMVDDVVPWKQVASHATVWNVYGPTENTIYCTAYRVGSHNIKQHNGVVSIGKAMLHTHTMIVDSEHQKVAQGETGELCLAGDMLTPGYWNDDEKNRQAFFSDGKRRWYLTGDICREDENGDIEYVGRSDSQVKIQGYRIELSEIESVARRYYEQQTAVVAVVLGEQNNQTINLVVECNDDGSSEQLQDFLRQYLPTYMLPSRVVFMPVFPQNANNKIDRKRIKESI